LGFVAVLAAAHVGICIYLDYALQAEFLSEDRRNLRSLDDFLKQVLRESTSLRATQGDSRLQQAKALRPNMHFVVRDAQGQIAESSYGVRWLLDAAASVQPLSGQASEPVLTITREGRMWRAALSEALLGDEARTAVAVVAAHDVTDREAFASRYRARLAAAALGAAIVAGLVGLVLVRTALAPIGAMARRAGAISVYRLGERLPENDVPRELRGLSVAFNQTLERLEDSFRRLSQFSSDLAHELRTPIGNLMGEAQVALRFPRSPEEYQEVLASAVEECERINRMIDGMLFLARAENAQAAMDRVSLTGEQEVVRVLEFYEGLLAERGVEVEVRGSARIWADPDLLRRALANLISNAISHTPAGRSITVELAEEADGSTSISVCNPGDRIPPEVLPHLFERFFRADPARGRSDCGSGLGLAIVRMIMQLHHGIATAASEAGGQTTFCLRFPGPSAAGGGAATAPLSVQPRVEALP